MTAREQAIEGYIAAIHNRDKQIYARQYYDWMRNSCIGPEPVPRMGAMAAQAVRLEIGQRWVTT